MSSSVQGLYPPFQSSVAGDVAFVCDTSLSELVPGRLASDLGVVLDEEHVLVRWTLGGDSGRARWLAAHRSRIRVTHHVEGFRAQRIPIVVRGNEYHALVPSFLGSTMGVPLVRRVDQSWDVVETFGEPQSLAS